MLKNTQAEIQIPCSYKKKTCIPFQIRFGSDRFLHLPGRVGLFRGYHIISRPFLWNLGSLPALLPPPRRLAQSLTRRHQSYLIGIEGGTARESEPSYGTSW